MKKPAPDRGRAFSNSGRGVEGLFFLLLQRFTQDVAEARTGIG